MVPLFLETPIWQTHRGYEYLVQVLGFSNAMWLGTRAVIKHPTILSCHSGFNYVHLMVDKDGGRLNNTFQPSVYFELSQDEV